MRTEAIFEVWKNLPKLSDAANRLLALIMFKIDGSRFTDENGVKFIYLSGNNDPAELLGYSPDKTRRLKRELKKARLITTKRAGFGKPERVYLHLENGLTYCAKISEMNNQCTDVSVNCKTTPHSVEKSTVSSRKNPHNASYIRKTKRKDQEERPRGTASPPCPTGVQPDLWEAYQEALRKEREQNEQHGSDGDDDLPTEIL